jgi:hypothetical protein
MNNLFAVVDGEFGIWYLERKSSVYKAGIISQKR